MKVIIPRFFSQKFTAEENFDEDESYSSGPIERPVKYWLKIESGFETRTVYAKVRII